MTRYKILADVETVFPNLRRVTGETLEARPGEVFELHEDSLKPGTKDAPSTLEHFLSGGRPLIAETDDELSPWPRELSEAEQVGRDAAEADQKSLTRAAKAARAEIRAAEKAALAVAAAEAAQEAEQAQAAVAAIAGQS